MNKTEQLERYKARLEMYYKAEEAILCGAQEYYIGSRRLRRADIAELRKEIKDLEDKVESLESDLEGNGRRRCVRVIPRDV